MTDTVVDESRLGRLGDRLGRGGQATVWELPDLVLPDATKPLVYKQYRRPHSAPTSLRGIVSARSRLDHVRRAWLDRVATWPIRVVEKNGMSVGVVMPRIPDDYFDIVTLPGTGTVARKSRDVQFLFIDPARARWLGRPVPTGEQRIEICRDFAAVLMFYHVDLSVVFGDINAMNEMYRLTARPTVLFVDCDGVRPRGTLAAADQLNSPDWTPPDSGGLSVATDLYKFGLFVLRCLDPGEFASTGVDPSGAAALLDQVGASMLRRAVGTDPRDRPTASDWYVYFSALLGDPVVPPVITRADLDRGYVCTGQPVTCEWSADNAVAVEVVTSDGIERVDGTSGSGSVSVTLRESGFVRIRASNHLGVEERLLGPVAAIPPPRPIPLPVALPQLVTPSTGGLAVPEPQLPDVPRLDFPPLPITLPTSPGDRRAPAPAWPPLSIPTCPLDPSTLVVTTPRVDSGLLNTGKTT